VFGEGRGWGLGSGRGDWAGVGRLFGTYVPPRRSGGLEGCEGAIG
jgi:hypothetical protein